MSNIHQTAIIGENVKIDESAKIGAYSIIEGGVEIGANSVIEPNVHIYSGAKIGKNCRICGFCTISGLPQDLHFDPATISYVEIGDGTVVREGSTIHRATVANSSTKIGKDCLLMANSHIAHDCILGDRVIVAPFSAAGGFVRIGDDTFISGGVMLHQKLRVGCGAMVSGNSAMSMDIPPYVNAYERNGLAGFNLIGLMRRKASRVAIANLKELYFIVYSSGSPRKNAQAAFEAGKAISPEGEIFLKFFFEEADSRPVLRPNRKEE